MTIQKTIAEMINWLKKKMNPFVYKNDKDMAIEVFEEAIEYLKKKRG